VKVETERDFGCLVVSEELKVEGGTWIWEEYFDLLLVFVICCVAESLN
jgi:hypothetical protein